MNPKKPMPFLSLMNETKTLSPGELQKELSQLFDKSLPEGLKCPVPGCTHKESFLSWGNLFDHFMDKSHKKDFFQLYQEKYHRSYGAKAGQDFKYGVMALMLAQFRQPTSLDVASKNTPTRKTASTTKLDPKKTVEELVADFLPRSKKLKKSEEQLPLLSPPVAAPPPPPSIVTPKAVSTERTTSMTAGSDSEAVVQPRRNSGAFQKVAEMIRNSDEINLTWRGMVLDGYIEMFHGIPPCFHCRSAEGKQIHHQNPLFHEIVLLMLNKLGTTADKVWEAKEQGNEKPLQAVLQEVASYHMKPGRVLAVPYCSDCNQDAELKRRAGKRKGF